MSAAAQLLVDLAGRGITVEPDGKNLRIRPGGGLSPELKSNLKRHKAEVLDLLCNRCERCRELEAKGHITLVCSECHYLHPKMRVLEILHTASLTAQEVADHTGLDLPQVYKILGRLYEIGLISSDLQGTYWVAREC